MIDISIVEMVEIGVFETRYKTFLETNGSAVLQVEEGREPFHPEELFGRANTQGPGGVTLLKFALPPSFAPIGTLGRCPHTRRPRVSRSISRGAAMRGRHITCQFFFEFARDCFAGSGAYVLKDFIASLKAPSQHQQPKQASASAAKKADPDIHVYSSGQRAIRCRAGHSKPPGLQSSWLAGPSRAIPRRIAIRRFRSINSSRVSSTLRSMTSASALYFPLEQSAISRRVLAFNCRF
jgi:hypothetical protein